MLFIKPALDDFCREYEAISFYALGRLVVGPTTSAKLYKAITFAKCVPYSCLVTCARKLVKYAYSLQSDERTSKAVLFTPISLFWDRKLKKEQRIRERPPILVLPVLLEVIRFDL